MKLTNLDLGAKKIFLGAVALSMLTHMMIVGCVHLIPGFGRTRCGKRSSEGPDRGKACC